MEQSKLLREWMQAAGLTREQAAEKLGIKPRRLDAWLLPEGSKERRTADESMMRRVQEFKDEALKLAKLKTEGVFRIGADADNPMVLACEGQPVTFPALFRCINDCFEPDGEGGIRPSGEQWTSYSFTPKCDSRGRDNSVQMIDRLDPDKDDGWISVVQLKSMAEVEGYFMSQLFEPDHALITGYEVCSYQGAFFVLRHWVDQDNRPHPHDGCILYSARYRHKHPLLGIVDEYEKAGIKPDGSVLNSTQVDALTEPADE
jgi:hypothetical protein